MRLRHLLGGACALLLLLPLEVTAENIGNVEPTSWDYGEVLIGDSETAAFSFQSVGPDPLIVENISVWGDETGSFQITSVTVNGEQKLPQYYFEVPVGDEVQIEVTFTPHGEGLATAELYVESNAANLPNLYVPLQGKGVAATPDEMMLDLLAFYDQAITEGWLSGKTRGQSGETTDAVFRDMLVDIYNLIVAGNDRKACRALSKAMLRIDGPSSPPDLVTGDVAPVVYAKLTEVFVALECD